MTSWIGQSRDTLVLENAQLEHETFSGQKVREFLAISSRFKNCRFNGMRIEQACFGAGQKVSEYSECIFDDSRISSRAPGFATFVNCSFKNVVFEELFCRNVEFLDCTFSGKIKTAFFNGTVPAEDRALLGRNFNRFFGNDFSEVELIDVGFRTGIDLTKQKLPSGPEYLFLGRAPQVVGEARKRIIEWRDLELRKIALVVIQTLELELKGGQEQLLLQVRNFSRSHRKAAEIVFEVLRSLEK